MKIPVPVVPSEHVKAIGIVVFSACLAWLVLAGSLAIGHYMLTGFWW